MNEVAIAGGKARDGEDKFYATNNQEELQAALEQISMQILSCVIDLNPVPKYPDFVEVTPYGKKQITDCASEDGWHYLPQMSPDDPLHRRRRRISPFASPSDPPRFLAKLRTHSQAGARPAPADPNSNGPLAVSELACRSSGGQASTGPCSNYSA